MIRCGIVTDQEFIDACREEGVDFRWTEGDGAFTKKIRIYSDEVPMADINKIKSRVYAVHATKNEWMFLRNGMIARRSKHTVDIPTYADGLRRAKDF